jgi:hypothetical protein
MNNLNSISLNDPLKQLTNTSRDKKLGNYDEIKSQKNAVVFENRKENIKQSSASVSQKFLGFKTQKENQPSASNPNGMESQFLCSNSDILSFKDYDTSPVKRMRFQEQIMNSDDSQYFLTLREPLIPSTQSTTNSNTSLKDNDSPIDTSFENTDNENCETFYGLPNKVIYFYHK